MVLSICVTPATRKGWLLSEGVWKVLALPNSPYHEFNLDIKIKEAMKELLPFSDTL